MGDEGDKGWVVDRTARLPPKEDGLFPVVEAVPGNPSEMGKSILMPADQGEKFSIFREIDVLPPRKAKYIGKTKHVSLAALGEIDLVRAPVHLALLTGFGLEPDDGLVVLN